MYIEQTTKQIALSIQPEMSKILMGFMHFNKNVLKTNIKINLLKLFTFYISKIIFISILYQFKVFYGKHKNTGK